MILEKGLIGTSFLRITGQNEYYGRRFRNKILLIYIVCVEPMPLLVRYLKSKINKQTSIETKRRGTVTGIITKIDRHMNITVVNAIVGKQHISIYHIRGDELRSFDL